MAKYIDADKLLNHLKENLEFCPAIVDVAIKNAPAADVAEVKHGYWKVLVFKGGRGRGQAEAKCSICGRDAVYQITEDKWEFENYCPHCGAKMDGGNDA